MTDDKPYRGGASGPTRSPFQPARADLVAELDVILRMDYDLRDDPLRDELERRRLELARQLFPIRPTAADWAREDIITSRVAETPVHEAPPNGERKSASEQLMDDAEGWARRGKEMARRAVLGDDFVDRIDQQRMKLRELARDLLDALHDPGPDDGAHLVRLQRTARPLAEFILGERDA